MADALVVLKTVSSKLGARSGGLTWYFVNSVLQTPVSSIMPTRNGMAARGAMAKAIESFRRKQLFVAVVRR